MAHYQLFIGSAGWAIPATERLRFPQEGSQLTRYSSVFSTVEINSSFYRPHRATTYARWAESVPEDFRFSVKMPKAITHEARLRNVVSLLKPFLSECSHLGTKLGCLLVQLPPSFKWDAKVVVAFFHELRELTEIEVCCEPRHPSWASEEVNAVFKNYRVAHVIADPNPIPAVDRVNQSGSLVYYRLHGSPRMYYSSYPVEYLQRLSATLQDQLHRQRTCWCIFDNTAEGAATQNSLQLLNLVRRPTSSVP